MDGHTEIDKLRRTPLTYTIGDTIGRYTGKIRLGGEASWMKSIEWKNQKMKKLLKSFMRVRVKANFL